MAPGMPFSLIYGTSKKCSSVGGADMRVALPRQGWRLRCIEADGKGRQPPLAPWSSVALLRGGEVRPTTMENVSQFLLVGEVPVWLHTAEALPKPAKTDKVCVCHKESAGGRAGLVQTPGDPRRRASGWVFFAICSSLDVSSVPLPRGHKRAAVLPVATTAFQTGGRYRKRGSASS